MTQSLFWREKVVRSFTIIVLFFAISFPAFSQALKTSGSSDRKITLASKGMHFEDLIHKLSEITGINFIYSANKIAVKKTVSVNFRSQSLDDIFLIVGRQMNLSFKRRDNYVIILKNAPAPRVIVNKAPSTQESRFQNDRTESNTETVVAYAGPSLKLIEDPGQLLSREYFKKRLHHYFDTTRFNKVPLRDLRKINTNNMHQGWFFSGGMMANNYSAGPELQVGIRSLYLTAGRRFLKNNNLYTVYGLGTSFLLSRNFSLTPSYTRGVIKQSVSGIDKGAVFGTRIRITEHQLRFLVQYSFDKKVNLKFGPTLSYLATKRLDYYSQAFEYKIVSAGTSSSSQQGNYYYTPAQTAQTGRVLAIYGQETSYKIGWEASIALKINFFERP